MTFDLPSDSKQLRFVGRFWPAIASELNGVPGELVYVRDRRARLTVSTRLIPNDNAEHHDDFDYVIGKDIHGRFVLMEGIHYAGSTGWDHDRILTRYRISNIAFSRSLPLPQYFHARGLFADVDSLYEWLRFFTVNRLPAPEDFKNDSAPTRKITYEISKVEPIKLPSSTSGCNIMIHVYTAEPAIPRKRLSLETRIQLEIRSSRVRSIQVYLNELRSFRLFMMFLSFVPVIYRRLSFMGLQKDFFGRKTSMRDRFNLLPMTWSQPTPQRYKSRRKGHETFDSFIFSYRDMIPISRVYRKWLNLIQRHSQAANLFEIIELGHFSNIEDDFTRCIALIETYHRTSFPPSRRREPQLDHRLGWFLTKFRMPLLKTLRLEDPNIITTLINARDYLTHYNTTQQTKPDIIEVFHLKQRLRAAIRCAWLMELGYSQKRILEKLTNFLNPRWFDL